MFFVIFYVFTIYLFGFLTQILVVKKGWETEFTAKDGASSQLEHNLNWYFLSLWFGPPIFFLLWAIPCRWEIPEEAIMAGRKKIQDAIIDDMKSRRNRNKFQNWIFDQKESFRNTIFSVFFYGFFLIAPLIHVGIILHFGFDYLVVIENLIFDF